MLVFEQFDNEGIPTDEIPQEEQKSDPLTEIEPLKKFYLSKRLIDVQSQLFKHGIQRDDLDFILKFQNELSYNALMILADKLLEKIEKTNLDNTEEKS